MCYLVGQIALQRGDDNTQIIISLFGFAETRWTENAEHRGKNEADSALVLNVQRISRFLTESIDCKKSQLFLRKIFEIEHADYCFGFNFKTFSKLHAVITRCHHVVDLLTEKPKLANQNTEAANGRADFLTMGCL